MDVNDSPSLGISTAIRCDFQALVVAKGVQLTH